MQHGGAPSDPFSFIRGEFHFACPHCGHTVTAGRSGSATDLECPHCAIEIIAPDFETAEPAKLTPHGEALAKLFSGPGLREMGRVERSQEKRKEKRRAENKDAVPLLKTGLIRDAPTALIRDDPEQVSTDTTTFKVAPTPTDDGPRRSVKVIDGSIAGDLFQAIDDVPKIPEPSWEAPPTALILDGESERSKANWQRRITVAALVTIAVLAVLWSHWRPAETTVSRDGELRERAAVADEERRIGELAKGVAAQVIAAPSWQEMLPFVRTPGRVGPIMAEYYDEVPHVPRSVGGLERSSVTFIDGVPFVEIGVGMDGGGSANVVLEDIGDGTMKVDWELLLDSPSQRWRNFRRERPKEPVDLRVTIKRRSVSDAECELYGLTVDRSVGFRIWHQDYGKSFFSVLEKGSPLARDLLGSTGWAEGRRLVLSVAYRGVIGFDQWVDITAIVNDGWVFHSGPGGPSVGPGG